MNTSDFFASSYAQARTKFAAACEAAGLDVHAHLHPMRGHDGEALALDLARFGPADAPQLLVISSGCHGVEGFCGSGIQNALLADASFQAQAQSAGVAVLYLHALNPYGFSWWRRTTHENIDLNRNWQDFSRPLLENPGYDELAHAIVPASWPPPADAEAAINSYAAKHGLRALQAAVSGGQYKHPQGILYGGRSPSWSQQTLRHVLQEHGRQCQRLAWIDLHTGLGPAGRGERILACRDEPAALARARAWWGPEVTSIYDDSSVSARVTGMLFEGAYQECPQAEYTGIALEYGTQPLLEVLHAMRAEQWLENHPEAGASQRNIIKRRMLEAFYTDTDEWRQQVVDQGLQAARQAVAGLMS